MLTKKIILVVEDNEINRMMLKELLSEEYEVLEAENGKEALAVLEKRKEEISLILLDITMPVMDGYTFLSIAKAEPSLASIPVIVTTQSDSEADELAALSHGASDFVPKPYKPQIILHRVASIIHLRETAAMINQFQHDKLTGLYSKEYFCQCVREILRKNPQKEYDIICSDIENFKLINDVFGMAAGDQLLCGIASLYREMVGEHGICGRLGSDHFVCMLEHITDYMDGMFVEANEKVNQILNAKSVVLKWGIYAIEDRSVNVEQMCDRALLAARSIKGQYGKYFAAYDDKLRGELLRQQAIIDEMESALKEGQFLVYLQPKYRIVDNTLVGAEALVRWKHPEWGFQSPGKFIPLFESNGFITTLDQFVWDRACRYLHEWDAKGYPPLSISVNVSRADIYNADIIDTLVGIVRKYELLPRRLHLEITESAYTENPEQIIETVTQLRELGFIIEMDDFGSGYSSLNMLNKMPIDVLKLDMEFIQNETAKPMKQGVLQFIMELARWMHLSVVAEGVETKEQLEHLLKIGCDYVQGYYFARPMPYEEFEALITEQDTVLEEAIQYHWPQDGCSCPKQALIVADEDPAYCDQVKRAFFDEFEVVAVSDGEALLSEMKKHRKQAAAVILSLTLPETGGFGILESYKKDKSLWDIPIIATGQPDMKLEKKAIDLGAADYAYKPHMPDNLRYRISRVIRFTLFQKREQTLKEEAHQDLLTGVLNRRGWEAAVESLAREDAPCAFYLFDIDNLKQVNDSLGHLEGDRLIRDFGEILSSHIRKTDTVARFGGDEFVAVMKQIRSEEVILKKGEEICREMKTLSFGDGIFPSVSLGIAVWNGEEPVENTIRQMDQALYYAKNNCKGGCYLWKGKE